MKFYFSGGSEITETYLKTPCMMLSFFLHCTKKGKPGTRFKTLIDIRRRDFSKIKEIWKWISGYKRRYKISNWGRVKSIKRKETNKNGKIRLYPSLILKPYTDGNGYQIVQLNKNGKSKHYKIHRLVLQAFFGPCPSGKQSRHLDGNPANNHFYNLKWGSSKRNGKDKIRHGTSPKGVKNGQSKLNGRKVKKIRKLYATGNWTMRKLAKKFKVSRHVIFMVVRKESWTHI